MSTMEQDIQVEAVEVKNRWRRIVEGMLKVFGIEEFVTYAQVMHNFFFVAAIVFIGVIEIFTTHLTVRMNRSISKKQETIKELRWEYIDAKTELNQKSKQSELQKILEPHGIKALQEPPVKVEVPKGTFKKAE